MSTKLMQKIIEQSLHVDQTEPFYFHQVDRDPETRLYGSVYIYTENSGSQPIVQMNLESKTIVTNNSVIYIGDKQSDLNLFKSTILNKWEKIKHKYVFSENYTDYKPAFISSLQNLHNTINNIEGDTIEIYG